MQLTRTRVIGAIVVLVVGSLLGYGIVNAWKHYADPYAGLITSIDTDIPDDVKETARQRIAVSLASLAASEATGGKIDLDIYISLAQDSLYLGDLAAARGYLETMLEGNSIHPAAWNFYGTVLEQMGDYDGAMIAYAKAVDFGDLEEYYRDVVTLIERQFPEREADIELTLLAAVEELGQTPWLMVRLAEWYESHNDCQRAEAHMKVAKTLSPENEGIVAEYDRIRAECN